MRSTRNLAFVLLITLLLSAIPTAPAYADTFTVNTTSDHPVDGCDPSPGDCTLRDAITAANLNPGPDTIEFDIPSCGGVCQIEPTAQLPNINGGGTFIDGYSQPGGTAYPGESTKAALLIQVDGTYVPSTIDNGFNITSAGNTIRGLIITRFDAYGIAIWGGAADNVISGNIIGTNVTDSGVLGNGAGVLIYDGAHDNTIGGDAYAERNVISGNAVNGVDIMFAPGTPAYDNIVSGNFIGTNNLGNAALPNLNGIQVAYGTSGNVIGGDTPQERNLISGNTVDGVVIWRPLTNGNTVIGNYIGTTRSGLGAVPNGSNGVSIYGESDNNVIGGDTAAERNVISGNGTNGVRLYGPGTTGNIVSGNYIGAAANGTGILPNGANGVIITEGASSNTIGGSASGEGNLISANLNYGVYITDGSVEVEYPDDNAVLGNLIGVDASGSVILPNGNDGVRIDNGAKNNIIGGSSAGARNVISGNDFGGVVITGAGTTGNQVTGNYIGLSTSGAAAVPNSAHGVVIWGGAQSNTIGGGAAGEGNVISGNYGYGVAIQDPNTRFNTVAGNIIGLNASGATVMANTYAGVRISNDAQSNTIGGDEAGEGNVISGNEQEGVLIEDPDTGGNVVSGNHIGTDIMGLLARGNWGYGIEIRDSASGTEIGGSTAAQRNVICDNGSGGIHVYGDDTDGTTISGNYIGVAADGSTALGNGSLGIWIENGPMSSTIGGNAAGERNVVAGHSSANVGITGTGTSFNVVQGNYIGLGADGLTDLTGTASGVYIASAAHSNTVGGDTASERNVISGNLTGVIISGSGTTNNKVIGSFIGTDASGTVDVGNGNAGVRVDSGAANNQIGDDGPGEGNLISGNDTEGIVISGAGTSGTVIYGNLIGTDVTGAAALGNGINGIYISSGANNQVVGGILPGQGNVISGNGGIGVQFFNSTGSTVSGNLIGVASSGSTELGNGDAGVYLSTTVLDTTIGPANRIAHNGGDGVLIFGAGSFGNVVTQNSIFDNDGSGINLLSGANNDISAPSITSTSLSSVAIAGTAASCDGCTIEVFSNPDADGEGKTYLGSTTVAGTSWSLTVSCISGDYLTATATDAADGTSEFSSVFTSTVKCTFLPLIMR